MRKVVDGLYPIMIEKKENRDAREVFKLFMDDIDTIDQTKFRRVAYGETYCIYVLGCDYETYRAILKELKKHGIS